MLLCKKRTKYAVNMVWTKQKGISSSCIKCFIGFGSNRLEVGEGSEEAEAEICSALSASPKLRRWARAPSLNQKETSM